MTPTTLPTETATKVIALEPPSKSKTFISNLKRKYSGLNGNLVCNHLVYELTRRKILSRSKFKSLMSESVWFLTTGLFIVVLGRWKASSFVPETERLYAEHKNSAWVKFLGKGSATLKRDASMTGQFHFFWEIHQEHIRNFLWQFPLSENKLKEISWQISGIFKSTIK